jgi:hypothetical protein
MKLFDEQLLIFRYVRASSRVPLSNFLGQIKVHQQNSLSNGPISNLLRECYPKLYSLKFERTCFLSYMLFEIRELLGEKYLGGKNS